MNQLTPHRSKFRTTQAAEGLPRRPWTVAEIRHLVELGVIAEDERFEMIGGELVPMSPKGNHHEVLKKQLQQHWIPLIKGGPIDVITETTLYYSDDSFLEPDFFFWPRSIKLADISAATALLIAEVAESSLSYDRSRKASIYAGLGLREYWVFDAVKLVTHVYREPGPAGYASVTAFASDQLLTPLLMPELAVRLDELSMA
jgi:Uma2 family endonuclease